MYVRQETVSAFAIYAMKRKALQLSIPSKKFKTRYVGGEGERSYNDVNRQPSTEHRNTKPEDIAGPSSRNDAPITRKHPNTKKSNGFVIKKHKTVTRNTKAKKNMKKKRVSVANGSRSSGVDNFEISSIETEKNLRAENKNKKTIKVRKVNENTRSRSTQQCVISRNMGANKHLQNPIVRSKTLFDWLIYPMRVNKFFENNWEKTPVHIKRTHHNYYKLLMSTPILDKVLRDNYVQFTKNIDITLYSNGQRETLNPPGRAYPSVVWDYYLNGCSVRMLNPQTFIPKLHTFNATLQEFFGCFVGANCYLTPPSSQGFAPHYDDIEAFILQIEGKKRWRLYKPRTNNDYLPRYSSKDFDKSEIGEPILDTVVKEGDLLYLPRGTIHYGETLEDAHSLHVTISVYQKNSWGDFFEKLIPNALQEAITNNSQFRKGLPLHYLEHVGFANSMERSEFRQSFKEQVKHLFYRLIDYIDIDKAADEMAKDSIHDFLPPVLADYEKECSVVQDGERLTHDGIVKNLVEIEPDTKIRLLRYHCIRLVRESNEFKIYYSCENSKEYHEYDLAFLEIENEFVPAVKELIHTYPEFIRVEDLPISDIGNKIQIAKDLWEKGIIVTEEPLNILD